MRTSALRESTAFPVDRGVVESCLDSSSTADALFVRGWHSGPSSLSRAERCAVAGVTGHVAESVAELLLDHEQWQVIWHFPGPGWHGIDLAFLTPDSKVIAVEVKGTLVAGRIPRLSHREVTQMSAEWVDKGGNTGMTDLGLQSSDVYGALVAINFADMTWRMAMTADFCTLHPVTERHQLTGLGWLTPG